MNDVPTKVCRRCKIEKPLLDFDEDKRRRGEIRPGCRVCNAPRDAYYLAHRDAEITRAKKSLASKGRTAVNNYKRERNRVRPELHLLQNAKQRARRYGLPFDLTAKDVVVPEFCPALGIPLRIADGTASPNSPSLDRIDPRQGYVRGNVIVLSHRANTIKSDASSEELRRIADFIDAARDVHPDLNGRSPSPTRT